MSDGAVLEDLASAPELSVGGEGVCRTGLFSRISHRWRVAGALSMYRSPKGDAASSPELTVGADGDAVDWYASRSVTNSRRGGIKVPPAATRSP